MDGLQAYETLVEQMEQVYALMKKTLDLKLSSPSPEVRATAGAKLRELQALFNRIQATLKKHEADLAAQGFTFDDEGSTPNDRN